MTHQASTEDKEFIKTFEAYGIPPDEFNHHSHVRMANGRIHSKLCGRAHPPDREKVSCFAT